ncbi:hypothetical protein GE09DRAFT_1212340 [Coniochaeta sp. 2T2.1]|nr:hypothetical protein GE09DRAFT_1212340 [Coniochaeta sp. 2T2.1]
MEEPDPDSITVGFGAATRHNRAGNVSKEEERPARRTTVTVMEEPDPDAIIVGYRTTAPNNQERRVLEKKKQPARRTLPANESSRTLRSGASPNVSAVQNEVRMPAQRNQQPQTLQMPPASRPGSLAYPSLADVSSMSDSIPDNPVGPGVRAPPLPPGTPVYYASLADVTAHRSQSAVPSPSGIYHSLADVPAHRSPYAVPTTTPVPSTPSAAQTPCSTSATTPRPTFSNQGPPFIAEETPTRRPPRRRASGIPPPAEPHTPPVPRPSSTGNNPPPVAPQSAPAARGTPRTSTRATRRSE